MQATNGTNEALLRVALPSDGAMYEPTLQFLAACGMAVNQPNKRRYAGVIPAIPGARVVFQRARDITPRVEAANADVGFVGFDDYQERRIEGGETTLVMSGLGYGRCELVVAVPEAWVDVESMADLADLSVEFQESGRELRIATKSPRLAPRFLFRHGVNYFSLPQVSGALEAAPSMGYADLIVDVTATGSTLRENRLKRLRDGTVIESEGCFIANRRSLAQNPAALETVRQLIERIEARRQADDLLRVTSNIEGSSEEAVAARVLERGEAAGLQGPTVSRVYSQSAGNWYSVTVFVRKEQVAPVVDYFRAIGGTSVSVSGVSYVFGAESESYRALLAELGLA